jgi:kanamycin kinase
MSAAGSGPGQLPPPETGLTSPPPVPLVPPVPQAVAAVAAARSARLVWENVLGGLTYEVGTGPDRCFVKWVPAGFPFDLAAEAARMKWARPFHPVPEVLGYGRDTGGEWLVTAPLTGENAVSERWRTEPAVAVRAVGEGLRALHEALPVDRCPFSWSAQDRLAEARQRAAQGLIDPDEWRQEHYALGVDGALALAAQIPPADRLVVCHGDSCTPNTLLGPDGRWSGHVDLGGLGVADRWADLAVATWSTQWNWGREWERPLLDAYGVEPDPDRIEYYRLLWILGP